MDGNAGLLYFIFIIPKCMWVQSYRRKKDLKNDLSRRALVSG